MVALRGRADSHEKRLAALEAARAEKPAPPPPPAPPPAPAPAEVKAEPRPEVPPPSTPPPATTAKAKGLFSRFNEWVHT